MIGNLAVGLQYLEMPFMIALASRYPQWIPMMSWCSLAAGFAALFLSSFANAVSSMSIDVDARKIIEFLGLWTRHGN